MDFTYLGVFGAGLLTFVSPCVLPMVPIIAANYLMAKSESRFARVKATLLFGAGFILTFSLMGLSLPFISEALGEAKDLLLVVSGLILLLYGLKMSGLLSLKGLSQSRYFSWMDRSAYLPNLQKYLPKSLHGFLFGATFGLAWTPCVGPILGGVMTYVASEGRSLSESVLLMVSFALGIVAPFVLIAFGGDLIQKRISGLKRLLPRIEQYTGYGLVLIAIMIFTQAKLPSFSQSSSRLETLTFQSQGQKTNLAKLVPESSKLLFFHSDHCPVCHQMEEYMPALERECQSQNFKIVRVNLDKMSNTDIARHFQVRAVPTMVLLSEDNRELAHTVGDQSELSLRRAISLIPNMTACADGGSKLLPSPDQFMEGETCDPSKQGLTCSS